MKNILALEDYKKNSFDEVMADIASQFEIKPEELKRWDILVAYKSVGDYGCDSSAWFLLRDRKTKELFEVHASHCSCMGFEDQWRPEATTLEYLKSEKFSFCVGGYDSGGYDRDKNRNFLAVKEFNCKLRKSRISCIAPKCSAVSTPSVP